MSYNQRREKALVTDVVLILRDCGFASRRDRSDNFRLHSEATAFIDRNGLEWGDWYTLVHLAHERIRSS